MVAGLEPITRRDGADRRPGRQRPAAEEPRHRDGLPELRALPAHVRVQEHGVRAEAAEGPTSRRSTGASATRRASSASRTCCTKRPRTLSGGQRQRVAMGRAIVREPQAFLMDEPLSNLDAKLRVEMRAEIARIQRDLEVTTIYVTHDQVEAMTLGDRVAVMRDGVLQQFDVAAGALRPAGQPLRRRVHRLAGDEPRRRRPRARRTAASSPASASTGCPSTNRLVREARRSELRGQAHRSSASGPRTSRTPPIAGRCRRPAASAARSTSARTWAPRSSSTSAWAARRCAART